MSLSIINKCCNCSAPSTPFQFFIGRLFGGFAEYIITQTNTNPITWFVGRRYMQADLTQVSDTLIAETCPGGGTPGSQTNVLSDSGSQTVFSFVFFGSCTPNGTQNASFGATSAYSPLINNPTISTSGAAVCGGGFTPSSFDASGYYDIWNHSDVFGAGAGTGGGLPSSTGPQQIFWTSAKSGGLNNTASGTVDGSTINPRDCTTSYFSTNPVSPGAITWSTTGSINSTSWSGSGTSSGSGSWALMIPAGNYTVSNSLSESGSGTLSNEVDYNAVIDSVTAQASPAFTLSIPNSSFSPLFYGFNDYPNSGVLSGSTMPYDGSLIYGTNFPTSGVFPRFLSIPYAVSYFNIGSVDTAGNDPFDSWYAEGYSYLNATLPYILVTYIVMSDGTLVQDTFGPPTTSFCQDGAASGFILIPQPSGKLLPPSLFTGTSAPIGRITGLIAGQTCSGWSGTQPSFSL